jgi:transcriptional regulator with XRE-family HTH domain
MPETLEAIANALKRARINKGLTQRALSTKIGLPQSHISKIENGTVDLQTSNLLELARALDLEIALVPRSLLPALQALERSGERPSNKIAEHVVDQGLDRILRKASRLQADHPEAKTFPRLITTIADLRPLKLDTSAADRIDVLAASLNEALDNIAKRQKGADSERRQREALTAVEELTQDLRALRNTLAHGMTETSSERRPAYSLEDNESHG